MIDVKQQRQQPEHQLLARRHGQQRALEALGVDRQKARAQRGEHLAVDALFEDGVDLLSHGVVRTSPLILAILRYMIDL